MADAVEPRAFLIGAGPGDPGQLTLRAVECLARADVVISDRLVPRRLLDFARPDAEVLNVGDQPGPHSSRCAAVTDLLIDRARAGKTVARLKGGDPFVFGRAAEEAAALRAAGIPYEIVPGITAACAAAACAELPITHREFASAVALVTGHECAGKPTAKIDWAALARFPGTLVVYMGIARLRDIARELVSHGKAASTPTSVVASAGLGVQRRAVGTLAEIANVVEAAGLRAPAVIVIGPAVEHAPERSWFEQRPFVGKRVLVTRPGTQASDLIRQLELLGAVTDVLPALRIVPLDDWTEVDARLARLDDYDWIAFTSVNGVRAFLNRLLRIGRDLRSLGRSKLAAIGPGTADALREYHLRPDLVPAEFRSEALAAELARAAAGQRILIPRANRGRDILRSMLGAVARVDEIVVYRQEDAIPAGSPALGAVRRGEVDYVILTSSNGARAVIGAFDAECRTQVQRGVVRLATISPVTSAAVAELGLPVHVEAAEYTMTGIVRALVADVAGRKR